MATEIIMPQLGESVVDGTVGEWLKQVGDTVEEYEPIVRVITDKVDTEVPAPADGVLLAINIPEGETVDSGVVLGVVGQPGEKYEAGSGTTTGGHGHSGHDKHGAAPTPAAGSHETAKATPVQHGSGGTSGGYTGHVSPVVARMAAEHQLDLSQITGTGRNGRITKKDVLAYLENKPAPAAQSELPPWEQPGSGDLFKSTSNYELETPAKSTPPQTPTPVAPTIPAAAQSQISVPGDVMPLSSMRKSIAEHMVRSKMQTSPHVTTVFEVDLSAVIKHRAAHKADFAKQDVKLTFTPYFVMASIRALQTYPVVNGSWTDAGIQLHQSVNIGMAVAIDEGLIVPVIKNAQDLSLMGLSRQVNDLADRARNRKLMPDDIKDSTFTITNHGVSGSLFATPIINQPNAAILGVGAIEKRVKVIDDAIAIRPCVYLTLTFDHRMIDGAMGDGFLQVVTETLANWS